MDTYDIIFATALLTAFIGCGVMIVCAILILVGKDW